MFHKTFFMNAVLVVGALIVVMMFGGCGVITPNPTVNPTATIESTSKEIALFLCQKEVTDKYYSSVVARTEHYAVVQAWDCNKQLGEILVEAWQSSSVDPDMNVGRHCFGDYSVHTTVRFEIQSSSQATAQLCRSDGHAAVCIALKLLKASKQWAVTSQSTVFDAVDGCPPP